MPRPATPRVARAPSPGAAPAAPPPPTVLLPRQKEWLQQLGGGEPFIVDDVAFAGRTAQLQRDSGLADLAITLARPPELKLRIEGHVDATHDSAADARLSMAMAKAAADRLADLGVPRAGSRSRGRGAENPRLPNFTARGRATNRRIEAVGLK